MPGQVPPVVARLKPSIPCWRIDSGPSYDRETQGPGCGFRALMPWLWLLTDWPPGAPRRHRHSTCADHTATTVGSCASSIPPPRSPPASAPPRRPSTTARETKARATSRRSWLWRAPVSTSYGLSSATTAHSPPNRPTPVSPRHSAPMRLCASCDLLASAGRFQAPGGRDQRAQGSRRASISVSFRSASTSGAGPATLVAQRS